MREFFTSVLAGVASCSRLGNDQVGFRVHKGAKKSPPILTRPSGLDTLRGTVRFRPS